MTHKPATPLPWAMRQQYLCRAMSDGSIPVASSTPISFGSVNVRDLDAAYIVAACNAYPRLVAALRGVMTEFVGDRGAHNLLGCDAGVVADYARALLRELGE